MRLPNKLFKNRCEHDPSDIVTILPDYVVRVHRCLAGTRLPSFKLGTTFTTVAATRSVCSAISGDGSGTVSSDQ